MKKILAALLLCCFWTGGLYAQDYFKATASAKNNDTVRITVQIPEGHYIYADKLKIRLASPGQANLTPHKIPAPELKDDPFSGEKVKAYKHDFDMDYTITPASAMSNAQIEISFQGCSQTTCFLPETQIIPVNSSNTSQQPANSPPPTSKDKDQNWQNTLEQFSQTGSIVGYVSPDEFLKQLNAITSGKSKTESSLFGGKNILVSILLVILGGLALNLTPCVLPMIPINIAVIGAGAQAGTKSRGFILGLVYGAGIAFSYGALGVFVVLTGATFGSLNSSALFNAAIAAVFAVLALGMFGVFELDFTRFRPSSQPKGKNSKKLLLPFFMGAVSALLAGACVAPVVISVLLFSSRYYTAGNPAGLFLPFVLGIGMALPWPFAGAGLSFLPKPGIWMDYVKKGFGVFIIIFALYYAHQAYILWQPAPAQTNSGQNTPADGWVRDLDAGLEQAAIENKPVILDFWASWCKNCAALDKITFKDPIVKKRLKDFVAIKVQAEKPEEPATKKLLNSFSVSGLPTIVILEQNKT